MYGTRSDPNYGMKYFRYPCVPISYRHIDHFTGGWDLVTGVAGLQQQMSAKIGLHYTAILLQLQPVTLQNCKNLTNFGSELALRFAKYTLVAHSILVRRFKLTLLGY